MKDLLTQLCDWDYIVVRCVHGYLRLNDINLADFKPKEVSTTSDNYIQLRALDEHHNTILLKLFREGRYGIIQDVQMQVKTSVQQEEKVRRIFLWF